MAVGHHHPREIGIGIGMVMAQGGLRGAGVQDVMVTTGGKFLSLHSKRLSRSCITVCSRGSDGSQNPGNNLHVSGLSHKVDNNELEAVFAKVGRVRLTFFRPHFFYSNNFDA